ncbi:MAG: hypothetical protein WAW90_01445, partial [Minisyncoccia bacterium]
MSGRILSGGHSGERLPAGRHGLAERRSRRRHYIVIVSSILFCIVSGALVYGLWQNGVRISNIVIYGADPLLIGKQESFINAATVAMQGSYLGIIPRDSIFFFPASDIREAIITEHPDIAALSIFRKGFTGLSIKVVYRVPVARWCGVAPAAGATDCIVFDANGFIYATTTEVSPLNTFVIYEAASST